jgi:glycosyltransferase involved in cell wall biosynthesis
MKFDRLHVVIVYPGVIPVYRYGGTGRDIWYEGKELTRMGHRVTYLTGAGSRCPFAEVLPYHPDQPIDVQLPDGADVVHFHFTPREPVSKPYMVTLHGNPAYGEAIDINTVFVSRDHARRHGSDMYVYNGMDWDDYGDTNLSEARRHFHFLANAAWRVKNLKGAIAVSRIAEERLIVLGGYRLNFRMGFRMTFDRHVSFRGFVGGEEKFGPMRQSKGLIFPVLWPEPMGLAVIESLYFGAPVFGTPYGSLPELVPEEVGFLTNSASSLAGAIQEAALYKPDICHQYAADCFNSRTMTEHYVALFEKVIGGETLNKIRPAAISPPEGKMFPWYP